MREFFRELFRTTVYKRNQGRITRRVTAVAFGIVLAAGVYSLQISLQTGLQSWPGNWIDGLNWLLRAVGLGAIPHNPGVELTIRQAVRYGLPVLLYLLVCWAAYRLVNVPRFADFLIAVEAEMNKVSWPNWSETMRSAVVVLVTMFSLAAVLYVFDLFWTAVFRLLGVV